MNAPIHPGRVRPLNSLAAGHGPVLYWMSRDQRVDDNWALVYAQSLAIERRVPLMVVFTLARSFLGATDRQYAFMLKGLKEVERRLLAFRIPFVLLVGDPARSIITYAQDTKAGIVVTDFSPLRIHRDWRDAAVRGLRVQFDEVDAHNIVPAWIASPKLEFAAYTIRPKIQRLLPEFLTDIPAIRKHPRDPVRQTDVVDWESVTRSIRVRKDVGEVSWIKPGEKAARSALERFITERASAYATDRNDPERQAQSDLSPYLHFGQISAQRVALDVRRSVKHPASRDAFLEELVIRKELSDNFCLYNPRYDSIEGIPSWAASSLDAHRNDPRQYTYGIGVFESARTHDRLWNAAQIEMVRTGKMHGYMRMYWAKKILEWTPSPEEAMAIAIELNDRYELDGRDPNGYAGIAWSIGGVHDRAWADRPVFGKIRYMNDRGCSRKFDTESYIARHLEVPNR